MNKFLIVIINVLIFFLLLPVCLLFSEIVLRACMRQTLDYKILKQDLFSFAGENFDFRYVNVSIVKNKDGNETFTFRQPSIKNTSNDSIIVAGCSFAFGCGLIYDDTFGAVLSNYTGRNVYNLGISGASPRDFLYILRDNYVLERVLLPKPEGKIKYVIYTYISDQKPRLFSNVYRKSPEFKLTKDKKLVYHKEDSIVFKSLLFQKISSFISYKLIPEKVQNELLNTYFIEINKEIHKIFGEDTQLVILVYYDCGNNWEVLKKQGIEIIQLQELFPKIDWFDAKYVVKDGFHPNRNAWELIVPKLVEELKLN